MKITGLRAVTRKLAGFKQGRRNKIVRKALRPGAAKIKAMAQSLVPVETGLLRRSIGVQIKTGRTGPYAKIGPRSIRGNVIRTGKGKRTTGAKTAGRVRAGGGRVEVRNPARYASLVEFGSTKMDPRPFMTPAFHAKKMDAFHEFKRVAWVEIKAEIRRA